MDKYLMRTWGGKDGTQQVPFTCQFVFLCAKRTLNGIGLTKKMHMKVAIFGY